MAHETRRLRPRGVGGAGSLRDEGGYLPDTRSDESEDPPKVCLARRGEAGVPTRRPSVTRSPGPSVSRARAINKGRRRMCPTGPSTEVPIRLEGWDLGDSRRGLVRRER